MADTTVSTDIVPAAPPISIAAAPSSEPENPAETTDDLQNKAIRRCKRAWNHTYRTELAAYKSRDGQERAEDAANRAFLRATPPLSGYQNICDFIACINYAAITGMIIPDQAQCFLANAKIAISAVCHQPKAAGEPRPVGRPPKPPA